MPAKKLTIENFIHKAKNIHGDKYDYSLVCYKNNRTKITIICPNHGEFEQRPYNHLSGHGCVKCGGNPHSISSFISKANEKHNFKYDYSLVFYKNGNIKISIICPNHGEFEQRPYNHLSGKGCPKCANVYRSNFFSSSNEEFIFKANKKHKFKYDYSIINYINAHTKISIICFEHGQFWQEPSNHLMGHGCSKCRTNFSIGEIEWLQSLNIPKQYHHTRLKIKAGKRNFIITDAYDPRTNTVYEFDGDYYHGNPEIYNSDDINIVNGKTFGELYEATIAKKQAIINAGYKFVSIWESEWNKIKR
jgi:hypothetical protein